MTNESPQVHLPGRIFRRGSRWWWKVQLPGEARPRGRALKPEGARLATTDRRAAQEIAFAMWQEAIRTETEARMKMQEAAKVQQLRAKLEEKSKALANLMDRARARVKAETAARAKLEAELNRLRSQIPRTVACECCGRHVLEHHLHRIDSGQRLCRTCWDALVKEEQRQEAKRRFLCPA